MTTAMMIPHSYNHVTIDQRHADGYVNATAACKANGKKFYDYFRLDTTQAFLRELSQVVGIQISEAGIPASENGFLLSQFLVETRKGGEVSMQGTWVHPQVAIHLAQWLSPKFAVAVSGWVFEWMTTGRHPLQTESDALLQMEDRIVKRITEGLSARLLPPAAPVVVAPRLPVYLETLPNGRLLRCCHYSNQSLVFAYDLLEAMDIPLKNNNVPGTLAFAGLARETDFLVVPVATMAQAFQCSPRELLDALTLTRKQRQLTWLTAQGIAQSSYDMAEWFADRSKIFALLKRIYINR